MSNTQLTTGEPVPEDGSHRELRPDGQQNGYIVLTPEERAKGFVQPVRRSYVHKTCGSTTTMGIALAETYARDPWFYSGTFCCNCGTHRPLEEFVWHDTDESLSPLNWTDEKFQSVVEAKKHLKEGTPGIWGIQIGLMDGDPILLASAFSAAEGRGQTMRPDQALRYSSRAEAQKHCDRLNSGAPILRPNAQPVNLNDLTEEQRGER